MPAGTRFDQTESRLTADPTELILRDIETAIVVAFVINPEVSVMRGGTIGDGAARYLTTTAQRPAAGLIA